jgi:hypothetical protein
VRQLVKLRRSIDIVRRPWQGMALPHYRLLAGMRRTDFGTDDFA